MKLFAFHGFLQNTIFTYLVTHTIATQNLFIERQEIVYVFVILFYMNVPEHAAI